MIFSKTVSKSLFVLVALLLVMTSTPATSFAHGVAGQRFFPTTFTVDDPFVSDEFSLLFHSVNANEETGEPKAQDLEVAYAKRILPNFGIEAAAPYQRLQPEGEDTLSGFGNLEVSAKYQFYTSAEHEAILSFGVADEIGNTGSRKIGSESFSVISPAFFFGRGFGDLPDSMNFFKPLAITAVIGPNFPSEKQAETLNEATGELEVERHPTTLTWAFTLQYSLMYLQGSVKDVGLGAPFNRMVAVVEFPMETCLNTDCKNQTNGTVNPGIAWIGKYTELGIAAEIPLNPRSGSGTGVFALFHLFIDDLFPKTIGRPIFP